MEINQYNPPHSDDNNPSNESFEETDIKETCESEKDYENAITFEVDFEKAFKLFFDPKKDNMYSERDEEKYGKAEIKEEKMEEIEVEKDEDEVFIRENTANFKNEEVKIDEYFPFTKGVGLEETLKKIGINQKCENIRFRTTEYYTNARGKKKKEKKKRKYKPDDIRKKIKSRFHKAIKNVINERIKKAGAKELFDCFPQKFITNITIDLNNEAIQLTYKQLIEKPYYEENSDEKKCPDIEKYKKNQKILKDLNNSEISKKSGFEKIQNMKYSDILRAYFISKEFEDSLIDLKKRNDERIDYIENYINLSLNYVDFFTFNNRKKKTTINK